MSVDDSDEIQYPAELLNKPKRLKTLAELKEGPNKDAAENEIEDKTYTIGVLCNFLAYRLVNSSGGKPPCIFDTENRTYIEQHPRLNVRTLDGRLPPFIQQTSSHPNDDLDLN